MKTLFRLLVVLAALSALAFLATFAIEGSYASRAKLIQRVSVDPALAALGDEGTPIGEPALMIVDDPEAFLGKQTPDGAEMVSETYLQEHKVYPLQLKTVRYVAGLVRLGSGAAAVLLGLAAVFARKRSLRPEASKSAA